MSWAKAFKSYDTTYFILEYIDLLCDLKEIKTHVINPFSMAIIRIGIKSRR